VGEVSSHLADASRILLPINFSDIPGWAEDDHAAALAAFRISAERIEETPPKTRQLGIGGDELRRAARLASCLGRGVGGREARGFFEQYFRPHRIAKKGFVTGYFEPEVFASRAQTQHFKAPLYRRPADLVEIDDGERPADWDPEMRFARRAADGTEPYFDRAAIEEGALAGRRLELAWLSDPVDAFFIHVQGSARLRFHDGTTMRIAFDGKSGHPYTSIGKLAVERGLLPLERADKDGLEAWLKSHPEEGRALMRENRSFIFFRETRQHEDEGPLGAAGVPLTPWRSLAVDRTLHTCHAPVWLDVPTLADPAREAPPFRRLMVAQDTGSAIVGPARGDIFCGSGTKSGSIAGRVRHAATMVVLIPNDAAGE
jgi:membrane-bound lytic murein transglycosylase A